MSLRGERLRVLVVDDDAVDREAVRRALRVASVPADIVEAEDGQSALECLARESFDCVLLDHLLPGTTALELLPDVRALGRDAQVIVLTGHGDERLAVELMKAGAADYLAKDAITAERLGRAVHYAASLGAAKKAAAQAETRRQWAAERLRSLVDAAPALYGIHVLDDLLKAGAERARQLFDAPFALVALWPAEGDGRGVLAREAKTELSSFAGPKEGDALLTRIAAAGTFARLTAEETEELLGASWPGVGALRDQALVATRLLADRVPVGYLAVLEPAAKEASDHGEVFLAQLAQLLATAAENTQLHLAKERALRARDDVLAVVSHDLRAPLGNLRLGVALLKELEVDDEGREVLERLDRGVTHMGKLVEDLLDMARIDGGQLSLDLKVEPVAALIDSASKLADAQAHEKFLTFSVTDESDGALVKAERHRLQQVLSNLLANAIKFTPEGGRVSLSATATPAEVIVSVRDSGIGIPAEDLPHVFTRFWRKDAKQSKRGLGLGLYIVKGIVEAHGGRMRVESAVGEGSVFTFTLPRSAATAG